MSALSWAASLRIDQGVVSFRDGVLPYEFLVGHQIAEVARGWTQVAVSQLEPSPGERVFELFRVMPPRDGCFRYQVLLRGDRHVHDSGSWRRSSDQLLLQRHRPG